MLTACPSFNLSIQESKSSVSKDSGEEKNELLIDSYDVLVKL
jgi:hypothetical protein